MAQFVIGFIGVWLVVLVLIGAMAGGFLLGLLDDAAEQAERK